MVKIVLTIIIVAYMLFIALVLKCLRDLMKNNKDSIVLLSLCVLELLMFFALLSFWGLSWATIALKITAAAECTTVIGAAIFCRLKQRNLLNLKK